MSNWPNSDDTSTPQNSKQDSNPIKITREIGKKCSTNVPPMRTKENSYYRHLMSTPERGSNILHLWVNSINHINAIPIEFSLKNESLFKAISIV